MCRCAIGDCGQWPTPDYTLTAKGQLLEPFEPFDAIRECSGAFSAYVVSWFRHIHKGCVCAVLVLGLGSTGKGLGLALRVRVQGRVQGLGLLVVVVVGGGSMVRISNGVRLMSQCLG